MHNLSHPHLLINRPPDHMLDRFLYHGDMTNLTKPTEPSTLPGTMGILGNQQKENDAKPGRTKGNKWKPLKTEDYKGKPRTTYENRWTMRNPPKLFGKPRSLPPQKVKLNYEKRDAKLIHVWMYVEDFHSRWKKRIPIHFVEVNTTIRKLTTWHFCKQHMCQCEDP